MSNQTKFVVGGLFLLTIVGIGVVIGVLIYLRSPYIYDEVHPKDGQKIYLGSSSDSSKELIVQEDGLQLEKPQNGMKYNFQIEMNDDKSFKIRKIESDTDKNYLSLGKKIHNRKGKPAFHLKFDKKENSLHFKMNSKDGIHYLEGVIHNGDVKKDNSDNMFVLIRHHNDTFIDSVSSSDLKPRSGKLLPLIVPKKVGFFQYLKISIQNILGSKNS